MLIKASTIISRKSLWNNEGSKKTSKSSQLHWMMWPECQGYAKGVMLKMASEVLERNHIQIQEGLNDNRLKVKRRLTSWILKAFHHLNW